MPDESLNEAVILVNLGTPASASLKDVRSYLREFLMDPLVIEMPFLLRWILVYGVIAPFRGPKSVHAYKQIWTKNGSPLKIYTQSLTRKINSVQQGTTSYYWAMRYGKQSICSVLETIKAQGVSKLKILPLYPQFALSSTQSTMEKVSSELKKMDWDIETMVLRDFYDDAGFIEAMATSAKITENNFQPDKWLFSFHGLPFQYLKKATGAKSTCSTNYHCCTEHNDQNLSCYRHQCLRTSEALADAMGLSRTDYVMSFQSRFGKQEWIKPYTNDVLKGMVADGVKRVAVICPAFVADCLETLEEVAIRAREDFLSWGGEDLSLVPCVNDGEHFVKAVQQMVNKSAAWRHLSDLVKA
ncbi:MAG: ferrochelatase [Gammaproteobacteria bacterium]|nr:ferrochelatase [Gammaproteobacteria bacterium]